MKSTQFNHSKIICNFSVFILNTFELVKLILVCYIIQGACGGESLLLILSNFHSISVAWKATILHEIS